jgi:hypothetical protein
MSGLDKNNIRTPRDKTMVLGDKVIIKAHLGGKSPFYNLTCMGADQPGGLMRADLTGLVCTYAQPSYKKGEKLNPSDLLLWIELIEMFHAPGDGKRYSSYSKVFFPRVGIFSSP